MFYSTNGNKFPDTLQAMTTTSPETLTLPSGVVLDKTGMSATGSGWTLTMTASKSGNAPTFVCS